MLIDLWRIGILAKNSISTAKIRSENENKEKMLRVATIKSHAILQFPLLLITLLAVNHMTSE